MLRDQVMFEDIEQKIFVSEELNFEVFLHLGHINRIFIRIHCFVFGVGRGYDEKFLYILAPHCFQEVANEVFSHFFSPVVHVDGQTDGVASVITIFVHQDPF